MTLLHVRGLVSILEWRHNGHVSVPSHHPHHCLLNRLFGCRSTKTSKLHVTGLCVGNSPGTGEFPTQMASKAENVSIWWRHHDIYLNCYTPYPGGWLCQWRLRHGPQFTWHHRTDTLVMPQLHVFWDHLTGKNFLICSKAAKSPVAQLQMPTIGAVQGKSKGFNVFNRWRKQSSM